MLLFFRKCVGGTEFAIIFSGLARQWMFAGYALTFLAKQGRELAELGVALVVVGFGIFSAAFALTLAIYRCPYAINISAGSARIRENVPSAERRYAKL